LVVVNIDHRPTTTVHLHGCHIASPVAYLDYYATLGGVFDCGPWLWSAVDDVTIVDHFVKWSRQALPDRHWPKPTRHPSKVIAGWCYGDLTQCARPSIYLLSDSQHSLQLRHSYSWVYWPVTV